MHGYVVKVEDKYVTIQTSNGVHRCKKSIYFMAVENDIPIEHKEMFHRDVQADVKSRKYSFNKNGVHKTGTAYTINKAIVKPKSN